MFIHYSATSTSLLVLYVTAIDESYRKAIPPSEAGRCLKCWCICMLDYHANPSSMTPPPQSTSLPTRCASHPPVHYPLHHFQLAPVRFKMAGIVFAMIFRSFKYDQLSMYAMSKSIHLSKSILLRPLICHKQVSPGLTLSLLR
jgi:hypothetical protein